MGSAGSSSLARSMTTMRFITPIWGAASPMPGASYMVSSISLANVLISSSTVSIGSATARRRASGMTRMGRMAMTERPKGGVATRYGISPRAVNCCARNHAHRARLESRSEEAEMITHEGGCSCRAVRYRVRGEPVVVGTCHCTACRKESGSVFVTYAQWPIADFSVTGDFSTFEGRSFCPRCGSRLFDLTETVAEIRIGSLDAAPTTAEPDPGRLDQAAGTLAGSRLAGAGQFTQDPPTGPRKTRTFHERPESA